MRPVISRYPWVPDHQVRTKRGIEVLVADAGAPPAGLEPDLRFALATAGLPGPEVRVVAVAAIPRSPLGKRLRIVALR